MKQITSIFIILLLLNSCTISQEGSFHWSIKQIRDGKITVADVNNDNKMDFVVSGYQKGGEVDLKKILWIESDLKKSESPNGKWEERGYSFYLDSDYKLWTKVGGKSQKMLGNFFQSNVDAVATDDGKLEILYNNKRVEVKDNKWEIPELKIWVDKENRLWVNENGNAVIGKFNKWKRRFNVVVNPIGEWIKGTGYKRGGKTDKDMVPIGDSIVAIDGRNQNPLWVFQTNAAIENYPTVYKEKVYIGSLDKNFYAINAKSGKLAWRFSTFGTINTTAAASKDLVYFGTREGYLYAMDAATGRAVWTFRAKASIDSSPAVYEDKVFFGSWDKNFYCLDSKTGSLVWKRSLPSYVGSAPIVHDEKVVFGAWDSNLYAMDVNTGRIEWVFKTDDWINKASPSAGGGLVYIGNKTGNLYAVNAATGVMKWQFNAGDAFATSAVVTKNRVFIPSRDGYLYALSPANGDKLWEYRTRFKIFGSAAVSGNDVIFSSAGGFLYAVTDTGMGRPSWPMFGGDPTHKNSYGSAYSYSEKLVQAKTFIDKFLEDNGFKKKN
jgi:outer membrane protein assembly factor BamB